MGFKTRSTIAIVFLFAVLFGIVLGPVIMALVQVLKHYGLPAAWAPFANVALSALAGVLVLVVQQRPDLLPSATLGLQVLILFLAAAGYYTTAKWVGEHI